MSWLWRLLWSSAVLKQEKFSLNRLHLWSLETCLSKIHSRYKYKATLPGVSVGQRLKSANFTKDFERNWLSISVPRADSLNSTEGPSTREQGRLDVYTVEAILVIFFVAVIQCPDKSHLRAHGFILPQPGIVYQCGWKVTAARARSRRTQQSTNQEQRVRNVPPQPAFSISWGTGSPLREWSCPQLRWGFPQELT